MPDKTTGRAELTALLGSHLLKLIARCKIPGHEGGGIEIDNGGKVPGRTVDTARGQRQVRRTGAEATGNITLFFKANEPNGGRQTRLHVRHPQSLVGETSSMSTSQAAAFRPRGEDEL
ncbi:MAG: hypothetical protein CMJ50_10040 [Planctomycetaceae bacterium]|jgi:hypothetical protein|nr:hypothetical protein [Planctomycetaceae bacterium]